MENTIQNAVQNEAPVAPTKEERRELARECKTAVSRCHFSTVIFTLAASFFIVAVQFVLAFIFGERSVEIAESPYFVWVMQVLCMYVLAFPVFLLLTKHLPRRDRTDGEKLGFGDFIGIFFITQAFMLIGSIVATTVTDYITNYFGIEIQDTTSDLIMQTDIWIVILVVVIIGPIVEELIFRKVFIDTIGKYNSRLAIFVSATSFSLFHGNITQIIYTFGAGLMLAWVYTKTKKMRYPIFLHMLINFFGSVPSLLIQDSVNKIIDMTDEELMNAASDPALALDIIKVSLVSLMQYGFMFIGVIVLFVMLVRGKFKLDREGDVKLPFFSYPRILLFNRGTLFFLVYTALTVVSNLLLTGM